MLPRIHRGLCDPIVFEDDTSKGLVLPRLAVDARIEGGMDWAVAGKPKLGLQNAMPLHVPSAAFELSEMSIGSLESSSPPSFK
jgi:hypothetical protein